MKTEDTLARVCNEREFWKNQAETLAKELDSIKLRLRRVELQLEPTKPLVPTGASY